MWRGRQNRVTLAFAGTNTLASTRKLRSISGTAVTPTYNGKTVGTGTLDSSGQVVGEVEGDVPQGATVLVTAGSTAASFVLAKTVHDTAVARYREFAGKHIGNVYRLDRYAGSIGDRKYAF